MIAVLNRVVGFIEEHLTEEIDVAGLANSLGTTEYHVRRMFSSLAGMPLSEYVRRRRMTVAAGDVLGDGDLLGIAVLYGYGSTEAFSRAFRAVHGISPGDVRRDGGPLRTQPQLRFRLTVEGNTPMDTRIADRPAFRLVGHSARVPLIYEGANPHIQAHIASLPEAEHLRLKGLNDTEPAGLLQVSADVDPDYTEGSELTYLHGVAVSEAHADPEGPRRDRGSGRCMGGIPHCGPVPGGPSVCVGRDCHRLVPLQSMAVATRPLDRGGTRPHCRFPYGDLRVVAAGGTRLVCPGRWCAEGAVTAASPGCLDSVRD